ncbi:MAG: glycine--tRNA ligase subunit beta [Candidatus Liberibacter ctenarytainae]|uniref:Glycine--tRNA ligase beta subunit n=1 Tax=Candidatus Liberibacter ctenarytainae TaxID=2020335 RepID=A0A937DH69_9HYPH|nr:glycine--tRNA ligase subunit beta [Candidatus Liberibacter ctenarytainae]
MPDFLCEVYSEEIPARIQRKAAEDFGKIMTDLLRESGLMDIDPTPDVRLYWTPRRLTVCVRGLASSCSQVIEEKSIPSVDIESESIHYSINSQKKPEFCLDQMMIDYEKGTFNRIQTERLNKLVESILTRIVPIALRKVSWPRSMRWNISSDSMSPLLWIRPIKSILCLLINEGGAGKVIPVNLKENPPCWHPEDFPDFLEHFLCHRSVGDILSRKYLKDSPFRDYLEKIVSRENLNDDSSREYLKDKSFLQCLKDHLYAGYTRGHRFHAPQHIEIHSIDDYIDGLKKAKVLIDPQIRRDAILRDARQLVAAAELELVEDDDLLEEVTGLVEWVQVLMGSFDEKYLCLPEEVIRLTIKEHQKCFVTRTRQGKLANRFVLVSQVLNGGVAIVEGNNRVVAARLEDALYFWKRDQENLPDISILEESSLKSNFDLDFSKPLDQRMAKLLNVTFHAKIGTQGERVSRIRILGKKIALLIEADADLVGRAAVLAKADLCTEIVREFPKLQGHIGAEYAALQGEQIAVILALKEHLKPRGPRETVPTNKVSIALALADKLDILIHFWAIGEKPSSSKDPYALRRAALGIIRILLENKIYLPLSTVIKDCDLILFFHERLKVHLRKMGMRYDLIESVVVPDNDNLLVIVDLIEYFTVFFQSDRGEEFFSSSKRLIQILAAEEKKGRDISGDIDRNKFLLEAEKELYKVTSSVHRDLKESMQIKDYHRIGDILCQLHDPIKIFFDTVLVHVKDQDIRYNRLALLKYVKNSIMIVVDIQKMLRSR